MCAVPGRRRKSDSVKPSEPYGRRSAGTSSASASPARTTRWPERLSSHWSHSSPVVGDSCIRGADVVSWEGIGNEAPRLCLAQAWWARRDRGSLVQQRGGLCVQKWGVLLVLLKFSLWICCWQLICYRVEQGLTALHYSWGTACSMLKGRNPENNIRHQWPWHHQYYF